MVQTNVSYYFHSQLAYIQFTVHAEGLGYMQHARHAIHGTCPDTLVQLHATGPRVWCSMSSVHVFAPCSSSMRTTSTLPYLNTPTCKRVRHLLFSAHAFAPCSSSTRTTSALPYSATVCNGVEPLISCAFRSTLRSGSNQATSTHNTSSSPV